MQQPQNNDKPEEQKKNKEEKAPEQECPECEEQKRLAEEYKAKYLRALADYQNFERRMNEQKAEWTKNANRNLIMKLLSFLDDLERAEAFVKDKNLEHIKNTFYKMLKGEGLEELPVLNAPYDPHTAEVVNMVAGEKDNVVIAVLRKGYMYNGHPLRVAQVTVSKKS